MNWKDVKTILELDTEYQHELLVTDQDFPDMDVYAKEILNRFNERNIRGAKGMNSEVPVEAIVKYIKRERDQYKEKLDKLVPYTKQLEAWSSNMEKNIRAEYESQIQSLSKRLENQMVENARLLKEKTALIMDYHKSEWYISMQKQNKRRNDEVKHLREALNRAMVALSKKEDSENL